MRNALVATVALLIGLGVAVTMSHAVEPGRNDAGEFCADANDLMSKANSIFHEKVTWTGKNKDGYRFILMTSPDSWTFVMTDKEPGPDGSIEACIKASDGMTAEEHKGI